MSSSTGSNRTSSFEATHPDSFRIETEGGTVYWLSKPDSDGIRWVLREHQLDSHTMIMQPIAGSSDRVDFGTKFRARLGGAISSGTPFLLEVVDSDTRILSEAITNVEVGNVPDLIFA